MEDDDDHPSAQEAEYNWFDEQQKKLDQQEKNDEFDHKLACLSHEESLEDSTTRWLSGLPDIEMLRLQAEAKQARRIEARNSHLDRPLLSFTNPSSISRAYSALEAALERRDNPDDETRESMKSVGLELVNAKLAALRGGEAPSKSQASSISARETMGDPLLSPTRPSEGQKEHTLQTHLQDLANISDRFDGVRCDLPVQDINELTIHAVIREPFTNTLRGQYSAERPDPTLSHRHVQMTVTKIELPLFAPHELVKPEDWEKWVIIEIVCDCAHSVPEFQSETELKLSTESTETLSNAGEYRRVIIAIPDQFLKQDGKAVRDTLISDYALDPVPCIKTIYAVVGNSRSRIEFSTQKHGEPGNWQYLSAGKTGWFGAAVKKSESQQLRGNAAMDDLSRFDSEYRSALHDAICKDCERWELIAKDMASGQCHLVVKTLKESILD